MREGMLIPLSHSFPPSQALSIRERALGTSHPTTAATLARLGALYLTQGKVKEAEAHCERALEARREVLGADHPETAESMGKLGEEVIYIALSLSLSLSVLPPHPSHLLVPPPFPP